MKMVRNHEKFESKLVIINSIQNLLVQNIMNCLKN